MKKLIFFSSICYLLIFFNNSLSQNGWFWLNPLPTRSDLKDLIFIDSNTGFSVGKNGTILKTTNSGYNWYCYNYFKSIFLNSVYFINNNIGFIIANDDLSSPDLFYYSEIIRTTNSGLNWNIVSSPLSYKLNKIYFINQNTGYAISRNSYSVGNNILKTTNGGLNWITINIPYVFNMQCISFLNNNRGVIAGTSGIIIKTTNSGNNWVQIKSGTENYNEILFKTIDTIFVVGNNGIILKSINGGYNWQNHSFDSTKNLFDIKFINSNTGYIAGGNIFKTTNCGNSWDSISIDLKARKISFSSNNIFYCLGIQKIGASVYDSAGLLYRSINSGYNWINIHSSKTINDLTSIDMTNENTGFIAGNSGTLLKTIDGNTWDSIPFPSTSNILSLKFINSYTGFAGCNDGKLYKTIDAGISWAIQATSQGNINCFSFPNLNTGFYSSWASGGFPPQYSGRIYKTTDAGFSWVQIYSIYSATIYKTDFSDVNTGYAVGYNLGILKTTNSGLNWFLIQDPPTTSYFKEVYFINSQIGFTIKVSQFENVIFKTINGGINWQKVDSSGGFSFTQYDEGKIQFVNNSTGYISQISFPSIGRSGNILKTTNEGNNWFSISNSIFTSLIFGTGLTNIKFINQNTGFIVGEKGIILKTTNGGGNYQIGIKNISTKIPKVHSLSQNYPNPFNPSTTISYKVARHGGSSTQVKLVVYNILGKEVAVLVNEKQAPGEYEVTFDGSAFPSGVYFYKLIAGDFSETKKMVLIK